MEFFTNVIQPILPYFVIAFIVAEVLLMLKERMGFFTEFVAAISICVLMVFALVPETSASPLAITDTNVLILTYLVMILSPLVIYLIANQFLATIDSQAIKHLGIFTVVSGSLLMLPLYTNLLACALGGQACVI